MAPLWAGAAAVTGGVLLALRLPWGVRALGLALLLPALWWQPARPQPGQFELLAADVGQGQAVLVRTARHALLYDAGPRYHQDSDAGERVLVPLLRALGERLDLLVLSHRDTDHTGGAAAVLAQQPQAPQQPGGGVGQERVGQRFGQGGQVGFGAFGGRGFAVWGFAPRRRSRLRSVASFAGFRRDRLFIEQSPHRVRLI